MLFIRLRTWDLTLIHSIKATSSLLDSTALLFVMIILFLVFWLLLLVLLVMLLLMLMRRRVPLFYLPFLRLNHICSHVSHEVPITTTPGPSKAAWETHLSTDPHPHTSRDESSYQ